MFIRFNASDTLCINATLQYEVNFLFKSPDKPDSNRDRPGKIESDAVFYAVVYNRKVYNRKVYNRK